MVEKQSIINPAKDIASIITQQVVYKDETQTPLVSPLSFFLPVMVGVVVALAVMSIIKSRG